MGSFEINSKKPKKLTMHINFHAQLLSFYKNEYFLRKFKKKSSMIKKVVQYDLRKT